MLEIKNNSDLSKIKEKKKVLQIINSGLEAGFPDKNIKKYVKKNQIRINNKKFDLAKFENIYLVSYGKSADLMAKSILSQIRIKKGIIVIPKKYNLIISDKRFQVIKSGHPLPDKKSVYASKKIFNFLDKMNENDFVIFCVSGGGSALLSYPYGISLSQKQSLTKKLLHSGATIQEINCVRKHLSHVKGGRLVAGLKCSGIALIMSDVEKNDISSISSGCTFYDKTRYSDAIRVVKKYNLENKIPPSIMRHLKKGLERKIPETPKKQKIENKVISSNQDCIDEMISSAKKLGISTKKTTLYGDIGKCVLRLASNLPKRKNSCLVFGGEPTVKVVGSGKGGRNQELVLRLLSKIKEENLLICSIGTDGIDGNTNYAGAIFTTGKKDNSIINKYLSNNDSNSFFKKYGGLVKTGPTHINVSDIGIIFHC